LVSALTLWPPGHSGCGGGSALVDGAQSSPPRLAKPDGHSGTPTQTPRSFDQTCAGQQQWPAVSTVTLCPGGHSAARAVEPAVHKSAHKM
jgi:hypothetical protein